MILIGCPKANIKRVNAMAEQGIKQIMVRGYPVGIVGLEEALEAVARKYSKGNEAQIEEELFKILGRKNYIPAKAEEDYRKAFLREFKKFTGQPYEQDTGGAIHIKVLGPGCAQCDRLEKELMEAIAETAVPATVDHVRDIKEIASCGVMGTPALIINGEVKSVGKVPPKAQLIRWLKEAS